VIPVANPDLSHREREYVLQALDAGEISSQGAFVRRFEKDFARFCEVPYAVAVANGTVALHLALVSMGIGPGDEVIVPALTFVATANAVVHAGAKPVFADVERSSWGIDPVDIERKITSRTKAIIPVHLYGHPADMDAVKAVARNHGLQVLEDAAQAHGSRYRGRRVGGLASMGTFSFYANKIIATGEGGAITTHDAEVADKLRILRDHGMDRSRRYWFPVIGYNYRMANLQAALGVAQLEAVDGLLARKQEIVRQYREELHGLPIRFRPSASWAEPVEWLITITLEPGAPISIPELITRLAQDGVDSRPLFLPLNELPPYAADSAPCPVTADLSSRGLNLPSGPVISRSDITVVSSSIRRHLQAA
jgi:perosamine synthetase